MLRHVMLIKTKSGAPQDMLDDVFEALYALKKKVPGVMGFSFGENTHDTAGSSGYSHIMMMDFVDKDYYDLFHNKTEYVDITEQLKRLIEKDDDNALLVVNFPLNLA